MLIESVKKHWPARKMEWFMALLTFSWGTYVATHPEIFTAPGTESLFAGMRDRVPWGVPPHLAWGVGTAAIGLARGIALYINGAHVRTPVVRAMAAFITMFVFTQVVLALNSTGIANTGIVVYTGLVLADMTSCFTAAKDAITAEVHRRVQQGTFDDHSRLRRVLARY